MKDFIWLMTCILCVFMGAWIARHREPVRKRATTDLNRQGPTMDMEFAYWVSKGKEWDHFTPKDLVFLEHKIDLKPGSALHTLLKQGHDVWVTWGRLEMVTECPGENEFGKQGP